MNGRPKNGLLSDKPLSGFVLFVLARSGVEALIPFKTTLVAAGLRMLYSRDASRSDPLVFYSAFPIQRTLSSSRRKLTYAQDSRQAKTAL